MLNTNATEMAFASKVKGTSEAAVTAIMAGAMHLIVATSLRFPRTSDSPRLAANVVKDRIRAIAEENLGKKKSRAYALAGDAFKVAAFVDGHFKASKVDNGDHPDLYRVMAESDPDTALAFLVGAVKDWLGHDCMANASRLMERVDPGKAKPAKDEGDPPLAKPAEGEGGLPAPSDYPADTPAPSGPFGLTEARKVVAPAIAKLKKAGDVDAIAALIADLEAALAEMRAPAPAADKVAA